MFAYVARQVITDVKQNVFAYELLFRDSENNCFPDIQPDEATSKLLTGSHLTLGVEEITGGKLAFINFHQDTLLYRFPTSLDPSSVVIEIVETVDINPKLIEACKHIRDLGYRIALDDYDFNPKWDPFLPYVHYVKVDISHADPGLLLTKQQEFKDLRVKWLAERVETREQYEQCAQLGYQYFQGYYFARPEVIRQKSIPNAKLLLLELMEASSSTRFDFDRINSIIERDVALSYMLLRFINNPIINKRNKITSLRHALTYMGEVEVKKFVALLALANLGDNKPLELANMSLVRAKFCELMAHARKDSDNPPTGFLVGLFSLLDAMLDQTMQQLMDKLPLREDVKQALCGEESDLRLYLNTAIALETGHWQRISILSQQLNITESLLHQFYIEAIKWGASMSGSLKNTNA